MLSGFSDLLVVLFSFRSVHTSGFVHWYGQISVLPASCILVRPEVKVHHAGGVSSGVSDGRSGTFHFVVDILFDYSSKYYVYNAGHSHSH